MIRLKRKLLELENFAKFVSYGEVLTLELYLKTLGALLSSPTPPAPTLLEFGRTSKLGLPRLHTPLSHHRRFLPRCTNSE
jgi:hypothetical protein